MTLLNNGNAAATNVVVRDSIPVQTVFKVGSAGSSLPSGITVTIQFFDGTAWTYTPVSGGCSAGTGFDACVKAVRWTLDQPLPATQSAVVYFIAKVK